MLALDKLNLRWIYVAPTHDIIEENIKNSPFRIYNFLHLKGRAKCCKKPEYTQYIKNGHDISSFCTDCQFKGNICTYQHTIDRAYKDTPNLCVVHAHINTFLPRFLTTSKDGFLIRDYYDVIIIDENPVKSFRQTKQISKPVLEYFRDCLVRTYMDPELIKITNLLCSKKLNYHKLLTCDISELNPYRTNKKFLTKIFKLREEGNMRQVPRNIIPFLFKIYDNIRKDLISHMIYWYYNKLNLAYFQMGALNLGVKMIALDGTATKAVWDSMMGQNIEIFKIHGEKRDEKSNVWQLNGGHYPITSWKKSDATPIRLCKMIDVIASKKKRKVLVCGTKYVCKKILSLCKATNIMFANYYNLRSRNEYYKHCDTVILACEPNPPQTEINSCVGLSGWDEGVWRLIYREEEMLQAVGRIREKITVLADGTLRENPEVYILPSTGVKNTIYTSLEAEEMGECKNVNVSNLIERAVIIDYNSLIANIQIDGGFVKNRYNYEDHLLIDCPISMLSYSKKYSLGKMKTRSVFDSLEVRGLILRRGGKYVITKEGERKLSLREKVKRGIIEENRAIYR